MRLSFLCALGFVACLAIGKASAEGPGDRFWIRTEALWLKRDTPAGLHGVTDESDDDDDDDDGDFGRTLSNERLDFNLEAGLRTTFGMSTGENTGIEFTFFGLHDWNTNGSLTSPDQALQPVGILATLDTLGFDVEDFNDAFRYQINYSSQLNSFELNCVRWGRNGLRFHAGGRFVSAEETFSLWTQDEEDVNYSPFKVKTRNYLFGPQAGAEYQETLFDIFTVGIRGNVGALLNMYERGFSVANNYPPLGSPDLFTQNDEEVGFASLLELGIFTSMNVTDNVTLRGGYNFLMLNGVAQAASQFSLTGIDTGNVLFHGPSAGLEVTW